MSVIIYADKCIRPPKDSIINCTLVYDPAAVQEILHPPDSGPEQEPFGAEKVL